MEMEWINLNGCPPSQSFLLPFFSSLPPGPPTFLPVPEPLLQPHRARPSEDFRQKLQIIFVHAFSKTIYVKAYVFKLISFDLLRNLDFQNLYISFGQNAAPALMWSAAEPTYMSLKKYINLDSKYTYFLVFKISSENLYLGFGLRRQHWRRHPFVPPA